MYKALGSLSAILFLFLICPFVLNLINKKYYDYHNQNLIKWSKRMRKYHKQAGVLIAVIAIIHGSLILGEFKLHTGFVLYAGILITAILGFSYYKTKKKSLYMWHKRMMFVDLVLLIVHLTIPDLFG